MKIKIIIFSVGALIGYLLGYKIHSPIQVVESAQPEIRQSDGSLVLARKKSETPIKKPLNPFLGGEWVRHSEILVKPLTPPQIDYKREIKPIKISLDLIRLPDQSYRVIANAENGEVIGGVDVPIVTKAYTEKKWTAGAIYLANGYGVFLERKVAGLVVGLDLTHTLPKYATHKELAYSLRLGISF